MNSLELFHVTPIENVNSIMKHGLIPQIGERSTKLGEAEPGIYLFPSYVDCENALLNWLGDEFEDLESDLVSLKILLPNNFPLETPAEWERVSRIIIDPDCIIFFKNEG